MGVGRPGVPRQLPRQAGHGVTANDRPADELLRVRGERRRAEHKDQKHRGRVAGGGAVFHP